MSDNNSPAASPAAEAAPATEAAEASAAEASEEAEIANEPKEVAPKQDLKRKFVLKIDGVESEEEIDLADNESLKKHLQLSKVAQKRMQEHALMRKDVENLLSLIKSDPRKILSDPRIGIDVKKFAEDIINEEIENLKKTPEQLDKEKLQKEVEELRQKMKDEEETRKTAEFSRLQEQAEREIDSEITSALDTGGLPKTPYTVKKMAELMTVALHHGVDIAPRELLPLLKKTMTNEIRELLGASPEEVMEELLGKDNISRLRKRNLQKMRSAVESAKDIKSTGANARISKEEAPKKISMKEFLKGNF